MTKYAVYNILVPGPGVGYMPETEKKIRSFQELPHGWHYGRGAPIIHNITETALAYYHFFGSLGFVETDAFPGVGGEIMVTAYLGEHYVGVTVESNRTFTVTWEFANEDRLYESDLSGIKASELLYNIALSIQNEICNISSWSILNTTTTGATVNSMIWHSRHQAMARERLLSLNHADIRSAGLYATTSVNATSASVESLPYSGALMTA